MNLRCYDYDNPIDIQGEVHFPGITIKNSEVGRGALVAQPILLRQVCTNGMVAPMSLRRVHLGEKLGEGVYSEETRRADAKAILLKVRDIVKDVLTDQTVFTDFVQKILASKGVKIEHPVEFVGNMSNEFGITEDEQSAILKRLLEDDTIPNDTSNTQFGIVQAITAVANTVPDPERGIDLQEIGGQLVAREERMVRVWDYKA